MNVSTLAPRRHDPPEGWSPETFQRVTDALAAALISSYKRDLAIPDDMPPSIRALDALVAIEERGT